MTAQQAGGAWSNGNSFSASGSCSTGTLILMPWFLVALRWPKPHGS